jgi:hypothetical protein
MTSGHRIVLDDVDRSAHEPHYKIAALRKQLAEMNKQMERLSKGNTKSRKKQKSRSVAEPKKGSRNGDDTPESRPDLPKISLSPNEELFAWDGVTGTRYEGVSTVAGAASTFVTLKYKKLHHDDDNLTQAVHKPTSGIGVSEIVQSYQGPSFEVVEREVFAGFERQILDDIQKETARERSMLTTLSRKRAREDDQD